MILILCPQLLLLQVHIVMYVKKCCLSLQDTYTITNVIFIQIHMAYSHMNHSFIILKVATPKIRKPLNMKTKGSRSEMLHMKQFIDIEYNCCIRIFLYLKLYIIMVPISEEKLDHDFLIQIKIRQHFNHKETLLS